MREKVSRTRVSLVLCLTLALLVGQTPVYADPNSIGRYLWKDTYDSGYGNDYVAGTAIDSQGNVIAAGGLADVVGTNGYATKYDANGDVSWTIVLTKGLADDRDNYQDVCVDSQDNVLLVGCVEGPYPPYHFAIVTQKYSPASDLLWERIYYEHAFNGGAAVAVDGDDNVYVTGYVFTGWGSPEGRWAILKYDPDGNLQPGFPWYYDYSSDIDYMDRAFGITVDGAGNVIVCGRRGQASNDLDWHVRKYDSSGTLLWEDTYASSANLRDDAWDVAVDSNGDVLVTGLLNKGTDNSENADFDWLTIKYAAAGIGGLGQVLWTRTYESAPGRSECSYTVAIDNNDDVLVGGYIRGDADEALWCLQRLDGADGNLTGQQVWEAPLSGDVRGAAFREGLLAVGGSTDNGADYDMHVVLLAMAADNIGRYVWEETYDGGYGDDMFKATALDSQDNLIAAGIVAGEPGHVWNGYAVKYDADGDVVWTKELDNGIEDPPHYSYDTYEDVCVDSQNNVLLVGMMSGSADDPYANAIIVQKYAPDGSFLWEERYYDGTWNAGHALTTDEDYNVYVVGRVFTAEGGPEWQWAILKYDPNGNLQPGFPWNYDYSASAEYADAPHGVAVDVDGNVIVAGQRGEALGDIDWHVRKYDAVGALLWEDTHAGAAGLNDFAYSVSVDGNGDVLVTGRTNHGTDNDAGANYDWLTIKYAADGIDGTGQRLWTRVYASRPGASEDSLTVAVDMDDDVLVGGYKYDSDGVAQWCVQRLDGSNGRLTGEQVWEVDLAGGVFGMAFRQGLLAVGGWLDNGTDYDCHAILLTTLGDLDGDGDVDQSDLGILLADWSCAGADCPGDCDGDGDTDQSDLGIVLAHWGEGA